MKLLTTIIAGLMLSGPAWSGDVYVVTDASGNRVYTDRPQTLPAERLDVHSKATDPVAVRERQDAQMKQYAATDSTAAAGQESAQDKARAEGASAEDRAKRCVEARQRYQGYMDAMRLYEEGPGGERRYLDSAQIDAARANAKKTMDEFCNPQ
jgi:hypothetical protein